ncbi:MAG: TetR/AcrR family transcriptional regulator [Caulobacter sp.]|nr:TetR/AcrR family transcriptional regulator [Caulobacter sp.]
MTTTLKKPQRSARKPKGDGHLRRGEILQAAERIFLAEGYQGATIRKIADEVGVSSTALYMHFRDKDEILLEICDRAIELLLKQNSEIAARPIDAVARVRLMLDAYMTFALENPNAYQLVFCGHSGIVSEDKQAATEALGDRCYAVWVGTVREIAAIGRLRTGTADSAAQSMWAACHGLVALLLTKPTFHWAPTAELRVVMLDGLLYGLVTD